MVGPVPRRTDVGEASRYELVFCLPSGDPSVHLLAYTIKNTYLKKVAGGHREVMVGPVPRRTDVGEASRYELVLCLPSGDPSAHLLDYTIKNTYLKKVAGGHREVMVGPVPRRTDVGEASRYELVLCLPSGNILAYTIKNTYLKKVAGGHREVMVGPVPRRTDVGEASRYELVLCLPSGDPSARLLAYTIKNTYLKKVAGGHREVMVGPVPRRTDVGEASRYELVLCLPSGDPSAHLLDYSIKNTYLKKVAGGHREVMVGPVPRRTDVGEASRYELVLCLPSGNILDYTIKNTYLKKVAGGHREVMVGPVPRRTDVGEASRYELVLCLPSGDPSAHLLAYTI
ncbi:uncharacterized protein LOC126912072 [Spodoptera frugiperda]|uniref:Uncharacterized protein LOC126912072 n=1 Tax=Spodoptera frugiperda TaxID=7108 RepID=A0A9R0F0Q4_SPOFR|nr:uncharacterized protein LOC126912072 [Spodoptera frugiperda]